MNLGSTLRQTLEVTGDQVEAYLALSDDQNPIHIDQGLAERFGFSGIVVPGGLIAILVGGLVRAAFKPTAIEAFKARFVHPLVLGTAIEVYSRVVKQSKQADGCNLTIVRLKVLSDGRVIHALFDAELSVRA